MKALSELLKAVKPLTVEGSCDVEIAGVEIDSRKVKQGDLFVAMKASDACAWCQALADDHAASVDSRLDAAALHEIDRVSRAHAADVGHVGLSHDGSLHQPTLLLHRLHTLVLLRHADDARHVARDRDLIVCGQSETVDLLHELLRLVVVELVDGRRTRGDSTPTGARRPCPG